MNHMKQFLQFQHKLAREGLFFIPKGMDSGAIYKKAVG